MHSNIVFNPGGSVNRNIPKFGVDLGAHTTANDSGSIRWKPECVWRSTEDMKHDWDGCVCIQPRVIRFRSSVNCMTNSSSSMVQVSLVECCFGIRSVVTTNLWPLSFPKSSPQVSLFLAVLTAAMDKKRGRQSRGKLTFFNSWLTGSVLETERVIRDDSETGFVDCGGPD